MIISLLKVRVDRVIIDWLTYLQLFLSDGFGLGLCEH